MSKETESRELIRERKRTLVHAVIVGSTVLTVKSTNFGADIVRMKLTAKCPSKRRFSKWEKNAPLEGTVSSTSVSKP